jgi:glycosyltransferase involved in cell wall biosynthesis
VGRNGDSVATALREILGQDKLIRQMRSAARRAAGSIFDWERAGSAHERFRQHLLKRGLGP